MFAFIFVLIMSVSPIYADMASVPAAYQGRFRPADTYARLWLYEYSHTQEAALDFLWRLHLEGSTPFQDTPFFYIQQAELKRELGLELKRSRFSYRELKPVVTPEMPLYAHLQHFEQMEGSSMGAETGYEASLNKLIQQRLTPQEIAWQLEAEWPQKARLSQAGNSFYLLPDRQEPGTWRSLKALKLKIYDASGEKLVPIRNFTPYSDAVFEKIRIAYDLQNRQELAQALEEAYRTLAGKPYREAFGKALTYPTLWQLKAEQLYFQWPLIGVALVLYAIAACLALFTLYRPISFTLMTFVLLAFSLHTLLLALRCYILMRPPVSNMFETVLYVPWVAMLAALWMRSSWGLLGATLSSLALLALLKVADVNTSMENVQAVLDSQYWLIVHVLMVVGSYGLFILCGLLGHCYLIGVRIQGHENEHMRHLASYILQAMYIGVALLIPGTILGGVWAAESWGRFWDWDPKESWAFISSCIYLLFIHAFRFGYIQNLGLSIGAIVGLQAIGFTWYGVNYILGTGLHSYGFGSGGELYYYLFLILEGLFLTCLLWRPFRKVI